MYRVSNVQDSKLATLYVFSNSWILQSLVGFSRQWNCTNLVKIVFHGWNLHFFFGKWPTIHFLLKTFTFVKNHNNAFRSSTGVDDCKLGWLRLGLQNSNHPNFIFDLFTRCLKITEKVSFNIATEASYVYIFSGQK